MGSLRRFKICGNVGGAGQTYTSVAVPVGSVIRSISWGTAGSFANVGEVVAWAVHDKAETVVQGSTNGANILFYTVHKCVTAVGYQDWGGAVKVEIPVESAVISLNFYSSFASGYTFLTVVVDLLQEIDPNLRLPNLK